MRGLLVVRTQRAACVVEAFNIQLQDCAVYNNISTDKLPREARKREVCPDKVVYRLVSAMFDGSAACVRGTTHGQRSQQNLAVAITTSVALTTTTACLAVGR